MMLGEVFRARLPVSVPFASAKGFLHQAGLLVQSSPPRDAVIPSKARLAVSPRWLRTMARTRLMDLSGMRRRPWATSRIASASSAGPESFCR